MGSLARNEMAAPAFNFDLIRGASGVARRSRRRWHGALSGVKKGGFSARP
jgi:hypothetical protein